MSKQPRKTYIELRFSGPHSTVLLLCLTNALNRWPRILPFLNPLFDSGEDKQLLQFKLLEIREHLREHISKNRDRLGILDLKLEDVEKTRAYEPVTIPGNYQLFKALWTVVDTVGTSWDRQGDKNYATIKHHYKAAGEYLQLGLLALTRENN